MATATISVTATNGITDSIPVAATPAVKKTDAESLPKHPGYPRAPMKPTGLLEQFENFEVTPIIGQEFPTVNLAEWLRAPNSDDLIRELAVQVSRRGVIFFRSQNDLTTELQKELATRLGELTGKPSTSKLHIHPVNNAERDPENRTDNEIALIDYKDWQKLYTGKFVGNQERKQSVKDQWHADIPFEPVPCDYAVLKMQEFPATGGDTMWANGYELYDRLSEPYQKFLETLTITFDQTKFNAVAAAKGFDLYKGARGAPENFETGLTATHPVVRTNPVTGWKSIYATGVAAKKINGLTQLESDHLINNFLTMICENHDLCLRHKWKNSNDVAIWDNRSMYHAATQDLGGRGPRYGQRITSLGERPYFDPNSKSRNEGLAEEEEAAENAAK